MPDDRAKLLRSLAIDRGDAAPLPAAVGRRWSVLAAGSAGAIAVLVLGAAWLLYSGYCCTGPRVSVATAPELPASTKASEAASEPAPAARPSLSGLSASGYVVARRKATIAVEITGKVAELFVEEGMVVEANQVVARLDSALAETDLSLAQSKAVAVEAAATAIAADLKDAERILARVQSLSEKSYASEAELTKAEAKVAVLRAQLGQAHANLQTARLDAQRNATVLEKHKIRAPFAGVVVERNAQPGEVVSPMSAGGFTRTGICTIVDMDSIEIEVDVNEAFIGRVRAGGAVAAVLDAYPDWTIPASVIAVVPTANREKATIKVRIRLKEKDPRILPDMAVKVKFLEDSAAADATASAAR